MPFVTLEPPCTAFSTIQSEGKMLNTHVQSLTKHVNCSGNVSGLCKVVIIENSGQLTCYGDVTDMTTSKETSVQQSGDSLDSPDLLH